MSSDAPTEGGSENPFRSPAEQGNDDRQSIDGERIRRAGGYVRQISIVATLMLIHGFVLLLVGLGALGLTLMFQLVPDISKEMDAPFRYWIVGIYGLASLLLLTMGSMQVFAGIRNLDFRSRTLGIVALSIGLASILTCYCAPTSIGLAIYGLIVYLNPEAEQAFRMRKEGHTKEDVLAMLNV